MSNLQRDASSSEILAVLLNNRLDLDFYEYAKGIAFSSALHDLLLELPIGANDSTQMQQHTALTTRGVVQTMMALKPSQQQQQQQQIGWDPQHRRVAYRSDRPLDLEADYNPRRLIPNAEGQTFTCKTRNDGSPNTIALVMWHDDLVDPLKTFYYTLVAHSDCRVTYFGLLRAPPDENILLDMLNGVDIVLWWNWDYAPEKMNEARAAFPDQTWVILNWDDPHSMFMEPRATERKHLFNIAFSSSTAALPTYMYAGAVEAHAFVPMVDDSHYFDPDPEYETDVAFVTTNLYNFPGPLFNRTAILHAIAADSRKTGLRFSLYGPEHVGKYFPEVYRGYILNHENRKVWSSAKISINLHGAAGYG